VDLDLVVEGGVLVDGSSAAEPVRADLGIAGATIAAIGDLAGRPAARRIDARGLVVAPGFIDAHVHSEHALLAGADVDRYGSLVQGVTTHATAADGFGWAPMPPERDGGSLWRSTAFAYGDGERAPAWRSPRDYLAAFDGRIPVNLVPFAPHQAIRYAALGWTPGAAPPEALAVQERALRDWLDAGAFGLATGLDYQPAASSTTDELVALARVAATAEGVLGVHLRYAALGRAGAYHEMVEVARRAGIAVAIAHEPIDDVSEPILERARAEGLEVSVDWYLYPAGCTHLLALLDPEDYVGGTDGIVERLRDPSERARIAARLEEGIVHPSEPGSWAYFSATRTGSGIGRTIPDLAADAGLPIGEMAVRLLETELPEAVLVYRRGMAPETFDALVRRTIAHPAWTLTSDGLYHGPLPHPRGFGTFVRFLRIAVREMGVLDLPSAIHRISGAVAARLRIGDRGILRVGAAADAVILDPATVGDGATWEQPRRPPTGIRAVLVNGSVAVERGRPTGALAGVVLRRGASTAA
jgi:N-acyl-D-amino-acid deacylase